MHADVRRRSSAWIGVHRRFPTLGGMRWLARHRSFTGETPVPRWLRGMAVPAMIQNLIDLRTLCPPRVPTVVAQYFRDRDAEVVPGSARFPLPACPECLMLAGGMRSQGRNLWVRGLPRRVIRGKPFRQCAELKSYLDLCATQYWQARNRSMRPAPNPCPPRSGCACESAVAAWSWLMLGSICNKQPAPPEASGALKDVPQTAA